MKYLKQNAGCISWCTRWARRPHTEKLLSTMLHTPLPISRKSEKNLMPRSFTFVCQLYCCSSKHNNNKALRITFNCCKTVSTSNMALATVNIDKIIKVTSASSYVLTSRPFVNTVEVLQCYLVLSLTVCDHCVFLGSHSHKYVTGQAHLSREYN